MSQEEVFDSFYRATRSDVLLQAFLLTGDLTAAGSAVKDAYAIAWQHWRKVSRRQEPLEYVRPLAYRLAQRRHAGRIWHRNRGLSEEHKQVLDALHRLQGGDRRVLLLVDVAGLPLSDAAKEVAVTLPTATSRLARARSEVSATLGEGYVDRLLSLTGPLAAAKLPRPSIVLRAGKERRRLHTVGAVFGVVALTVGSGAVARDPGLDRATAAHRVLPDKPAIGDELPDGKALTTPEQLLQAYQLSGLSPDQTWDVVRTDNNTKGDGINTICQQTRFADPRGVTALVRTFEAAGKPARTALQTVEVSRDAEAAERAYDTTIGWFAGCQEARLQMMAAYEVSGVGDQAGMLQVQVAGSPTSTYNVAVARFEEVTTTLVVRTAGGSIPRPDAVAAVLTDAVGRLCPSELDGCTADPVVDATPPPASGEEPGFVATVDLPPAGEVKEPWVGVPSVDALRREDNTTRCDRAHFRRAGATEARARTWLIPEARVPETFGFTETYAVFKTGKAARAFMTAVRSSVEGCEDRDLTANVSDERHDAKPKRFDLSAWRFDSKISDEATVSFRVGFVRVGKRVAKLVLVPDGKTDIHPDAFEALVRRAGERLRELA